MERDPADKKSKKKSSKEAKHKRRKEEKKAKEKHKRRRSRSRSSSSSSSSGGDARAETPAQELARLREACTQLRSLLRSFPDVPRRDVRLLLWNVDAGQGVALTPLPGAPRSACCARFRSASADVVRCLPPARRRAAARGADAPVRDAASQAHTLRPARVAPGRAACAARRRPRVRRAARRPAGAARACARPASPPRHAHRCVRRCVTRGARCTVLA